MPPGSPSEPNGSKVSIKEFYDALMQQNARADQMEQRLIARIDALAREFRETTKVSPALSEKVGNLEKRVDDIDQDLDQVKTVANWWNGANSVLAVIAGILGVSK